MPCPITVAYRNFANVSNIGMADIRNSSQTHTHKHKATHCSKTTNAMTRYLLLLFIRNHGQNTRKIRRRGGGGRHVIGPTRPTHLPGAVMFRHCRKSFYSVPARIMLKPRRLSHGWGAYLEKALVEECHRISVSLWSQSIWWRMGATNVRDIISEWQKDYSGVTGDCCGRATHLYTKTRYVCP
jgi:hypothetical protein